MDSKFIHICSTSWLLFIDFFRFPPSDSKQPNPGWLGWIKGSQIVFVLFLHGKKGFRFNFKAQQDLGTSLLWNLKEIVVENWSFGKAIYGLAIPGYTFLFLECWNGIPFFSDYLSCRVFTRSFFLNSKVLLGQLSLSGLAENTWAWWWHNCTRELAGRTNQNVDGFSTGVFLSNCPTKSTFSGSQRTKNGLGITDWFGFYAHKHQIYVSGWRYHGITIKLVGFILFDGIWL